MNLRKEKKITDRDRPRIKNQGQTLKELPKISTQKKKKKKKITNSNSDPLLTKLNKSPYQSPNLHMHIHTQREREKDRVYEMNRCFDVLDKSWATLIISWFMAMVSPNVIPLHSAKPSISISITITISMPIHLSSLLSLSLRSAFLTQTTISQALSLSLSLTRRKTQTPITSRRRLYLRSDPSLALNFRRACVCVWESHRHSRPTSKPLYYYLWIKIKY